ASPGNDGICVAITDFSIPIYLPTLMRSIGTNYIGDQWTVDSDQSSVDSDQWSVFSDQSPVDSGQ
ncbi:MAG TPA: hypothetical protein P5121_26685, partial [Caldilineaceae bacterium]|nr:hypothetical protein [Caldilineaceae bacterium]